MDPKPEKPTREGYLQKHPEIVELLEKRPEIKAFLDNHPEILLGREAYEYEEKYEVEDVGQTYDYECKPFPEMVLVQQYRFSIKPDAKPEEQHKRLFVAAIINDEEIEKRFRANAGPETEAPDYKNPEEYLQPVGKPSPGE